MLEFKAVREKEITFSELVSGLTREDMVDLTNEMVDVMLDLIADCVDADIVFVPDDPDANDPYASNPKDIDLSWILGHVIVHTTASSEEDAVIAAEMARGVKFHGRSRYEQPWESMRTIEACRHRLEESRRIRLATLGMWPDDPHIDYFRESWPGGPRVNAIGNFALGLMHDDSHLGQIAEIVRQAEAARA